ncbi:hypothetical protein L2E82_34650 [Cichorium intybus]|uniref:Uncharacterized protein n=1 Tax=Cichorium intybus TaxID=13427 RepID=A0ACB9BMH8_CICIN|nr:hypothetical protein L2E82_34650 [Cichorium intybus]
MVTCIYTYSSRIDLFLSTMILNTTYDPFFYAVISHLVMSISNLQGNSTNHFRKALSKQNHTHSLLFLSSSSSSTAAIVDLSILQLQFKPSTYYVNPFIITSPNHFCCVGMGSRYGGH